MCNRCCRPVVLSERARQAGVLGILIRGGNGTAAEDRAAEEKVIAGAAGISAKELAAKIRGMKKLRRDMGLPPIQAPPPSGNHFPDTVGD